MIALLVLPGIAAWAFFMVQCAALVGSAGDTYTFNGWMRDGKVHEYGTPLSSCSSSVVSAPPDYTYCMELVSKPGLSTGVCAAWRLASLDAQTGMLAPFAECVKE